jgi:cytidylate kinase
MREIAGGVAEALRFAVVDEEIIQHAAAESGLEQELVADAEKRRSFVARTIEGISPASASGVAAISGAPPVPADDVPASSEVRDLIRRAVEETAEQGNMVIVAHAASHALASRPDVLRVLVNASQTTRRARIARERGLSEKDAARAIDRSDAGRADYLNRFYKTKTELPTHYDVMINTDRVPLDEAVAIVVRAAKN